MPFDTARLVRRAEAWHALRVPYRRPRAHVLAMVLALALPGLASAACETRACPASLYGAAVDALQGLIAEHCTCDPTDGSTRRPYARCVKDLTKDARKNVTVTKACAKAARRCALQSTCGRPGAVICCKQKAGVVRARVVKDERDCAETGVVCPAHSSTSDACDPNGGCTPGATTSTTSTTLPPVVSCPSSGAGLPSAITFTVAPTGSDLDYGWTGDVHNRSMPFRAQLTMCLSECDGDTDPDCRGVGPTGEGSVNGATFGSPLPIYAFGVPMCVVNELAEDFDGTMNLATGSASAHVKLVTQTYVTGDSSEVCPRCIASGGFGSIGTCSTSAVRAGEACTVQAQITLAPFGNAPDDYLLSTDCLPPSSLLKGVVALDLPLTTAEARLDGSTPCTGEGGLTPRDDRCIAGSCTGPCSGGHCVSTDDLGRCIDVEGGIAQQCCSDDGNKPCFPSAADSGGAIVRTGTAVVPQPAWPAPGYPKIATGTVLASTFCLGATEFSQTNLVIGLPGPGALLLATDATVTAGE